MRFFIAILALALVAVVLIYKGLIEIPSRYNPWAPLMISDPINVLTSFKFSALEHNPAQCYVFLSRSQIEFTQLPDNLEKTGCEIRDVVQVRQTSVDFSSTCALAAAWTMFEHHTLQPLAQHHFNQPVSKTVHWGTYACRNVGNSESGRRSEHAAANAIDIAAFILEDGTRISIQGDWQESGEKSTFLKALRDDACRIFDVTLSPDYNQAHHDHLHLDMGAFRMCR